MFDDLGLRELLSASDSLREIIVLFFLTDYFLPRESTNSLRVFNSSWRRAILTKLSFLGCF
jgi:hypothetical protein